MCTPAALAHTGAKAVLHSFDGADGREPEANVIEGSDGNFYGTTAVGGTNREGTVFRLTASGTLTTLYSFCSQAGCTDGNNPEAGLLQASDGNFYGTTAGGGANRGGTVFKITPSGTLMTLYSFCSQPSCSDGASPLAGVIQGSDGNFYGTTYEGGGANDAGTVFKLTPSGTLTTLYSFCLGAALECSDGANPFAGVIQGRDGNFYGTTSAVGANHGGTVFKLTPSGTLTTFIPSAA